MNLFKFMQKMVRPFRFWILGLLFLMTLTAIDSSLHPYLTKLLIDSVIGKSHMEWAHSIWTIAGFYILLQFLIPLSWRFYDWIALKYEPALKNQIAKTLTEYVWLHSHRFFQNHFAGSITSKIQDAAIALPAMVKSLIDRFYTDTLVIIVACITFWFIHPWFALSIMCWVGIFILYSLFFSKKFKPLTHPVAEASSKIVGNIVDSLSNMSNVRFFNGKDIESNKLARLQEEYLTTSQKRRWFLLKFHSVEGFLFAIYQSICLALLISLYGQQQVTAGDFAMILTLNLNIMDRLWHTSNEIREFSENYGTLEQALKIIFMPHDIQDNQDASTLIVTKGQIIFENVHFQYDDTKPIFEKKSIMIHPGEKVGLVGYSGSGKSTFINLILRLFDVNQGRILIDGQDICHVTQHSLRQAISTIPQETILFHRTLKENILYGKNDATEQEMIEAAIRANAHEFITQLPLGYDSVVGERGIKLSGGQRQRIAIARAILNNAPILILDEATSQLDSISEQYIQESLWKLMADKTTLVIAHRLSTLLKMDRILVFNEGKIIQDGKHADLIQTEGLYKVLWEAQSGGFLGDMKVGVSAKTSPVFAENLELVTD